MIIETCGHIFCHSCIINDELELKVNRCPTCRNEFTIDDLQPVKGQGLTDISNMNQLIENYGSKIANIVTTLERIKQESKNYKVIMFSQWGSMLHMIGRNLSSLGYNISYCEGNVYMRNNAIANFKEGRDNQIMMLSLEKAASGTNLICATDIILVDVVDGPKKKSVEIERQAIHRAIRQGQDKPVTLHRFIMTDSIEYECYMRNREDREEDI
jgi:SNF2 family DNA or RNA helicase